MGNGVSIDLGCCGVSCTCGNGRELERPQSRGPTAVKLVGRGLTAIPPGLFDPPFSSVATLQLSDNRIAQLPPPDQLCKLTQLTALHLDGNVLATLPDAACEALARLETLVLRGNRLQVLPDAIAKFQALKRLDLSSNDLHELPECIKQLTNLETLSLRETKICVLPDGLVELPRLRRLLLPNLVFRSLVSLPAGLGKLGELAVLDVGYNALTSLPPMAGLARLETLRLGNNSLTQLPSDFGSLTALRTLKADNNRIRVLPASFAMLQNLVACSLDRNGIASLPKAFCQLRSLQSLSLSHNHLTAFPPTFHRLGSLSSLQLRGNAALCRLPPEIGRLQKLKFLGLADTGISKLPPSFGALRWLVTLEAFGTGMESISYNPDRLATAMVQLARACFVQQRWAPSWHAAYGEQARPFLMTVLLAADRFAAIKQAKPLPQEMWIKVFRCFDGCDTLGQHVPVADPTRQHFIDESIDASRRRAIVL